MITANNSLQVVRLRGNEFPDSGKLFLKGKKISASLRVLDVADTGISSDDLEAILDSPVLCDAPAALVASLNRLHANSSLLTTLDVSWSSESGGAALNDDLLDHG